MVIFKESSNSLIKNSIGQNKNGSGSYSFSPDDYKAGRCGKGHTLSGDIPQGNATYDAARKNMKEPWVMFTKDQGQELIDNTTSEWITLNNTNGRKFINKTDTSKYIFLPAAGYWYYSESYGSTYYLDGHLAQYWATTLSDSSNTWYIQFLNDRLRTEIGNRSQGQSIRPVRPW